MKTDYLRVNCRCELQTVAGRLDWWEQIEEVGRWAVLGWPKSLFGFFHKMLWKNPSELFGQPSIRVDDHQLDLRDEGKEGVKNDCQNFG